MTHVLALARLLDELHHLPRGSYEPAARVFLRGAVALVQGRDGYVVLARHIPQRPAGILDQWHPMHLVQHLHDPERDRLVAEFVRSGKAALDRRTVAQVAEAGKDRAFLRAALVSDREWQGSAAAELDLALGRGDLLLAAAPLDPDTEVYAGVSRAVGEPPFGENERDLLLASLVGARASLRRAARTLGVLGPDAITPRQREVLERLLTGASEKEIAHSLAVGVGTVHHHVVAIYRAFRVRSRAELMALWLGHHVVEAS